MTYLGRRISGWATASNQQAVANARRAATACSRRRVEREEVALYLADLADRADLARAAVTPATVEPRRETVAATRVAGVDSLSG